MPIAAYIGGWGNYDDCRFGACDFSADLFIALDGAESARDWALTHHQQI